MGGRRVEEGMPVKLDIKRMTKNSNPGLFSFSFFVFVGWGGGGCQGKGRCWQGGGSN